jgi:hypothetical protein
MRGEPERIRLTLRAISARKHLGRLDTRPPRGRAWINGRPTGEGDDRFAHLGRSYD